MDNRPIVRELLLFDFEGRLKNQRRAFSAGQGAVRPGQHLVASQDSWRRRRSLSVLSSDRIGMS